VIVQLYSPTQAAQVMKDLWPKVKDKLQAGKKLRLEIKQAKRSTEQNDMFHALIHTIAKKWPRPVLSGLPTTGSGC